jgi:ABC-2 type transport system permease protein
MNYAIVKTLIWKDWYLQRWPLGGCVAGGLLALSILGSAGQDGAFAGTVLLITVMIMASVSVALATIAGERKDQTLAFVMSLPVSSREYTASKMLGGAMLLIVPWTALTIGTLSVIVASPSLPNGLLPHTAIMMGELLASAFVLLAVALVTESQGWTIAVMIVGNLFINWFLYYLARNPAISTSMRGPTPVWNETVIALLLTEFAVIVAALGLAFYFQDRKTDFL